MIDDRKNKFIALAKQKLKHPTKERLQVISRREVMKAIMRLKLKK